MNNYYVNILGNGTTNDFTFTHNGTISNGMKIRNSGIEYLVVDTVATTSGNGFNLKVVDVPAGN